MKKPPIFRQKLLDELQGIKTVDSHSHTRLKSEYYADGPFDLFTLTSYFERDIQTSARTAIYEGAHDDRQRWQRLKTALTKAQNVSYWRHNIMVYQNLFNMQGDELHDGNWKQLNSAIRDKTKNRTWYDHVTKDYFSQTEALSLARRMFSDNAKHLYGLDKVIP